MDERKGRKMEKVLVSKGLGIWTEKISYEILAEFQILLFLRKHGFCLDGVGIEILEKECSMQDDPGKDKKEQDRIREISIYLPKSSKRVVFTDLRESLFWIRRGYRKAGREIYGEILDHFYDP